MTHRIHFLTTLFIIFAVFVTTKVSAHGYVMSPPARGYQCKLGNNSACGAIQYEPQSLEGFSGYPGQGPADGRIASAGLTQFSELDEQTSSRWTKTNIAAGTQNFTWNFTANHVTRNWRYYLTKVGWDPNQKLTRSAFETNPFCTVDGNLQRPAIPTTHTCTVPDRTGYQVILAVWEIGDTDKSFYNAIDVLFKAGPPPVWESKGTIYPDTDLSAGDAVQTRVFDTLGERPDLVTRLVIATANDGKAATWAYQLASRINAEQAALLRAGQLDANGNITPVYGQNTIYAQQGSIITRVEIQITKAPPSTYDIAVTGLNASYPITNGQATISYTLVAKGNLDISSYLYDSAGVAKAYATLTLNNASKTQSLPVAQALPGTYQLVVKAITKDTGALLQKTYSTRLSGPYDYVFPDGLKDYKAGTKVLQPKNNKIYECRPYPYSGYCVQWSPGSNQYEPGIGSAWQQAWILR